MISGTWYRLLTVTPRLPAQASVGAMSKARRARERAPPQEKDTALIVMQDPVADAGFENAFVRRQNKRSAEAAMDLLFSPRREPSPRLILPPIHLERTRSVSWPSSSCC